MYVLHAQFSESGFWEFWAEDSELARGLAANGGVPGGGGEGKTAGVKGAKGRAAKPSAGAARHPFAADPAELAKVLAGAGPVVAEALSEADPRGSLPLALPSGPRAPLPGDRLARLEGPLSEPAPPNRELRAWIVPTLALDPAAGAGLLLALGGGDLLTVYDEEGTERELPLDPSVAYAHAVAAFADALVSRGEIHPWLAYQPEERGYFASWVPAYVLESAAHRRSLISAMPPAFRCQLLGEELTGLPAEDVFDNALAALVDAYVLAAFAGPHGLHGEPLAPATRGGRPSAAELWLRALTTTKGNRLDPDLLVSEEADELIDLLEAWTTAAIAEEGPVRTCFRLRDPGQQEHDVEDWSVDLLLQSTQDPSLLASAPEVWKRSGAARLLRQSGVDPRQALLQGLGRAARYFPQLGDALRQPSPDIVRLNSEQALHFLRHTAPALRERGFGVLLPPWWAGKRARISLNLHAEASTSQPGAAEPDKDAKFGLQELLKYQWQASIGAIELTDGEFMELAAAKTDLVKLRGEWIEVDAARLAAAAQALGSAQTGTMTAAEVLNKAMHGLDQRRLPRSLLDNPLEVKVSSTGWLGDLLAGAVEQEYAVAKEPRGLKAKLRPYQKRGVGWLTFMDGLGLGAILADDMGLGKTVQVLTLLEQERADTGRKRIDPTLLICPMSLVANWQREAERFTPRLKLHVHHGSERLEGKEFQREVKGVNLVITTYALALRDREQLGEVGWRRIVIDEAQAIKNAATKQARAVRSLPAPRRIALTGTPVENRLADLWSIMEFANPGLLGSAEQFKDRFARPIERGNEGADAAAERLRQATSAFVLRRVKTDPNIISDLPDKVEMPVVCNLTSEQASLYQAEVDRMLAAVQSAKNGIGKKGVVLAGLTRLKQICNHPALFLKDGSRLHGRSGKLARVEDLCDEVLTAGERALLFTQYAEFGGMLQRHLAERFGRPVAFLHGGTTKTARDELVRRFEQPDGPSLFVLSLKAGGVGLNLTTANHVLHVDRWWNPAVENQATDRAFRIGQRKNVQVRKLMCAGTLEERIDRVIEEKKGLAERIVGSGESWLTELSVTQLRDLVLLSGDPVAE
ncbi:DEAD/DEAH box helicase [Actinospica sp.]|uniref:DEAD/DEAH box helicase n=1 Tax=Actinospica sp. TaxID=1872142 RepID=UPI002BEE94BF|nr:DEAD/DEAH box helicase [Actinospica sp.]HWG28298.1 DEAD/DEAH box helicase [Actinospica sp.]